MRAGMTVSCCWLLWTTSMRPSHRPRRRAGDTLLRDPHSRGWLLIRDERPPATAVVSGITPGRASGTPRSTVVRRPNRAIAPLARAVRTESALRGFGRYDRRGLPRRTFRHSLGEE